MDDFFNNKKILITGGAGSVGCALTRRLLKFGIKTVRVFDISENEIFRMMNDFGNDERLRYLVGDIRDRDRLQFAMDDIDYVIHLAAMKHVHACEYNAFEAIKSNVYGLQNVIDASRNGKVRKVIFSSTDKAVNPIGALGITKLLGEKIIASANYYKGNRDIIYASVRFGNVIGSNGSVVPLFKKQITACGPVTITHEGMTRFVIEMDESVDLIFAAIEHAKGGETFVWKMRTLRVVDLADAMIELYGGGQKINKILIGKGEGEKLHEEMMTNYELPGAFEFGKFYAVLPTLDYMHIERKYSDVPQPQNPMIDSSQGNHLTKKQIMELLRKIDEKNMESLAY